MALPPLDQFRFHHVLAETPGTALVIFTSEGCSSCRHWKQVLTDYQRRHAALAIFEVDAGRDLALAREFHVFHLPALFLFRDGQFHAALQSEARTEHLHAAITRALAQPAQEPP
jgi:thioredoxin-like negative regulator of GroEL